MIQNVLIIRNGIPISLESFGQCHSIDAKSPLFAGFLEAFYRFSEDVSETEIETVAFRDALLTLKCVEDNLLFIIISNKEDSKKILNEKLDQVINLFLNEYTQEYIEKERNFKNFFPFRQKLLELEIVEEACGLDHCDLCPILMEEETGKEITKELNNIKNRK